MMENAYLDHVGYYELHLLARIADSKWLSEFRPRIRAAKGRYSKILGYSDKRFVTLPGDQTELLDAVLQSHNPGDGKTTTVIARTIVSRYADPRTDPDPSRFFDRPFSVHAEFLYVPPDKGAAWMVSRLDENLRKRIEDKSLLALDSPEYIERKKLKIRESLVRKKDYLKESILSDKRALLEVEKQLALLDAGRLGRESGE